MHNFCFSYGWKGRVGPCGECACVPQVFVRWGWVNCRCCLCMCMMFPWLHVLCAHACVWCVHVCGEHVWVLTAPLRVAPGYLPDHQPIILLLSPAPGEESEGQGLFRSSTSPPRRPILLPPAPPTCEPAVSGLAFAGATDPRLRRVRLGAGRAVLAGPGARHLPPSSPSHHLGSPPLLSPVRGPRAG